MGVLSRAMERPRAGILRRRSNDAGRAARDPVGVLGPAALSHVRGRRDRDARRSEAILRDLTGEGEAGRSGS